MVFPRIEESFKSNRTSGMTLKRKLNRLKSFPDLMGIKKTAAEAIKGIKNNQTKIDMKKSLKN
jgi:hypothetical protein